MMLTRWKLVVPCLVLLYFGYSLGGFFRINYLIGGVGLVLGVWQIYKSKHES